jgi:hypothetical protein
MEERKMSRLLSSARLSFTALIFVAALLLLPCSALSAVKTLRPEKFTPIDNPETVRISPLFIASWDGSVANFWAPVKLPVGARVTELAIYTWGINNPSSMARLLRTRIGEANETALNSLMYVPDTTVNDFSTNPPHRASSTLPEYPTSDLRVRKGYRYYVMVQSKHLGSLIHAVKIHYKKP